VVDFYRCLSAKIAYVDFHLLIYTRIFTCINELDIVALKFWVLASSVDPSNESFVDPCKFNVVVLQEHPTFLYTVEYLLVLMYSIFHSSFGPWHCQCILRMNHLWIFVKSMQWPFKNFPFYCFFFKVILNIYVCWEDIFMYTFEHIKSCLRQEN